MTVTSPAGAASPGLSARPPGPALPRLLPRGGRAAGLAGHLGAFGPLPYRGGPGLLTGEVAESGLTGRGGAAFPVARKLAAVAAGRRPVVVGNGAESEPLSGKDAALLRAAPHLVLDGLQLAAEAVGARRAILAVHPGGYAGGAVAGALAQRQAAGVDRVPVELAEATGGFLAGQETALVSALNGGLGRPAFAPPRVSERGVGGHPTLVQNVETLAHLALIARFGAAWFRSVGTGAEPGSMLATVWQADGRAAVIEPALATPLGQLLDLSPGAGRGPVQAVLVGGYHGAWLPAGQAAGLALGNASLRPAGAAAGAGVLAALPAGRCGLAETARVARYLALASSGQCGPCLNGLPRIAAGLAELAGTRPRPTVVHDLERWAGLTSGRGACHHPDGTVRFVRSALVTFAAEVRAHAAGWCSAPGAAPFLLVPADRAAAGGPR
jgi:NADH:ubiquinone oxidoreductase subunit F (NADH-binding)